MLVLFNLIRCDSNKERDKFKKSRISQLKKNTGSLGPNK